MTECFLGEIRMFAFPFAPDGWALCDGSALPAAQNQALFSLLGTSFGGTTANFKLPDMRGRTPIGTGTTASKSVKFAVYDGAEKVVLDITQVPPHNHATYATTGLGTGMAAQNNVPSANKTTTTNIYASYSGAANQTSLAPATLLSTGSGAGHNNMQPYLAVNYCIATKGIYPPRD